MRKKALVSIIVLNYNGVDYLRDCLRSVKKQSYKHIEIIVTDNHSTDGTELFIKSQSGVKMISHRENYGYAKANNIGAVVAKGEFILFLNNDTTLYPDFIEKLVRDFRKNTIVAPAQIRPWDKDNKGYAGFGMDVFGYPFSDQIASKTKLFYADGAAIFIRKDDFLKIGMFDEDLFIFQEDIDLSWRAQIMGYKIERNKAAKYKHFGGATIPGRQTKDKKYISSYFRRYLNEKNVIRNMLKNYSFPILFIVLPVIMFLHILEMTALLLIGKYKVTQCYVKAYIWNIQNFRRTIKLRKSIQQRRVISDLVLLRRITFSYSKLDAFARLGIPQFN